MANVPQELSTICRFCLCQNVKLLLPIVKTLHTLLTIEDIERFTGIEIDPTNLSYTVCLECINKLKISTDFRSLCLTNDVRFKLLHSMLVSSAESAPHEPTEMDYDSFEQNRAEHSYDESVSSQSHYGERIHTEKRTEYRQQTRNTTKGQTAPGEDAHFYSANYIEPGVTLVSDEEDIDEKDFIFTQLNTSHFPSVKYERQRGKRKLHLCNVCGIFVKHIPKHIINHEDDITEACPHCPVKMKQKTNLIAHIKTVHLKTINKTCEICGKGFVHHKTYRYHMKSHQDEGRVFECQSCLKTFSHSNALKDHFNRLHNIARKQK
ncbi:zinc finger protein 37-like [Anopheles maculipalpis]|uniref:zinc finger protein 37-like n=1 Tax=Anopheles maculipalpis TaxID=1496333 RepID=UPI002158ACCD|nr:zinc finger protein 37-like [Anopheles maculipalpis]